MRLPFWRGQAAEEKEEFDAVIVGAGLTGLSAALQAQKQHSSTLSRLLVTEAGSSPGGVIETSVTSDGFLCEGGPNSAQPTPALLQTARECGLGNELVFGDPKAPRFVLWKGKLRPVPTGPGSLLTSDLLSTRGKLRAALGALGVRDKPPGHEESVEQFVRRNLGAEVFERLVEPFCSGVYAGDPAKLSIEAAFGKMQELEASGGSLIEGAIAARRKARKAPKAPVLEQDAGLPAVPKGRTVVSFQGGLQALPKAMAAQLDNKLRLGWRLERIERAPDDSLRLHYSTPKGRRCIRTLTLALTVPAHTAAGLLQESCPGAAQQMETIHYPPVAAVTLAYPLTALQPGRLDAAGRLPGFGQLHPRSQGLKTLGTIYASSLFPGRAPPGWQTLHSLIGGAQNTGIAASSDDELVQTVDAELRTMLVRQDAEPPKTLAVRMWPQAIPQFNLGHLRTVQEAQTCLREAGLPAVLAGNYVDGVALGSCIEAGAGTAQRLADMRADWVDFSLKIRRRK